jgi:outer membrane protein OmpA-like peptidoglycan-associated protein
LGALMLFLQLDVALARRGEEMPSRPRPAARRRREEMKTAAGIIVLTIGCAMSPAAAPVALGQSGAPSQVEITNALRPVPPSMQRGEQGLPTPGTAPLATPSRQATPTSLSAGGASNADEAGARGHLLAVLPGCTVANEAPKVAVTFPTITFEFASARLTPGSLATLQNLGKSLKQDFPPSNTFMIEGHTDAAGTFAYNQDLSRQRAEAVKDYLVQQVGVKPDQLGVSGMGYCELADPAKPRGAENRRVVIVNKAT